MNTVFEIEDSTGRKYIADEEWWLKQTNSMSHL